MSTRPLDIAGALVILGIAADTLRRAWRAVYRFQQMHDVIVTELLPNGGGSMRDILHDIDRRLKIIESKQVSTDA